MNYYVNLKIKYSKIIYRHFIQKIKLKFVKIIRNFLKIFVAFMRQLCYYHMARCENVA